MSETNPQNLDIIGYDNRIRFKSKDNKRFNLGDSVKFRNNFYVIVRREYKHIEKEYIYEGLESILYDNQTELTDLLL